MVGIASLANNPLRSRMVGKGDTYRHTNLTHLMLNSITFGLKITNCFVIFCINISRSNDSRLILVGSRKRNREPKKNENIAIIKEGCDKVWMRKTISR